MVVFFSLRDCVVKLWNEGMLLDFDFTHWPDFGIGFRLGK